VIVAREVGNCQICEGDQKLHGGLMVHHGYRRPGDGYIVGDCPGVGAPPYEVSCDLVRIYLGSYRGKLADAQARLVRLASGQVGYLTETTFRGERVEFVAGVTAQYYWDRAVEHATSSMDARIRRLDFEIGRCTARIAAWKLAPVRTVEEEQKKADGEKAVRKAAREEARAARDAKKAATAAKQEALAAKRLATRLAFEEKFRTLAAGPQSFPLSDRQASARSLLAEVDKKKYWLSRSDLECADAFVALGLATIDGQTGHTPPRPYLRWI